MILNKKEATTEDYTALNEKVLEDQLQKNYAITYEQSKKQFNANVSALSDDNIYYKVHQDDVDSHQLILEKSTVYNIPVNEKYVLFYLAESIDDKSYVISQYVIKKDDFNTEMISETLDYMSEEILKYTKSKK